MKIELLLNPGGSPDISDVTKATEAAIGAIEVIRCLLPGMSKLSFRTVIVPNKTILNHANYGRTHGDWYYKMYFYLLRYLLGNPAYKYCIYVDIKNTHGYKKVERLRTVLCHTTHDFRKEQLVKTQEIRSHEVELAQLSDFLFGAIVFDDRGSQESNVKSHILGTIEEKLDIGDSLPFLQDEYFHLVGRPIMNENYPWLPNLVRQSDYRSEWDGCFEHVYKLFC